MVFLNYLPTGAEDSDVVGVRSAYGESEEDEAVLYAFSVYIIPLEDPDLLEGYYILKK